MKYFLCLMLVLLAVIVYAEDYATYAPGPVEFQLPTDMPLTHNLIVKKTKRGILYEDTWRTKTESSLYHVSYIDMSKYYGDRSSQMCIKALMTEIRTTIGKVAVGKKFKKYTQKRNNLTWYETEFVEGAHEYFITMTFNTTDAWLCIVKLDKNNMAAAKIFDRFKSTYRIAVPRRPKEIST